MAELPDPMPIAKDIEPALGEVERRLLQLIRDGSQGIIDLDDVINGFAQIAVEIRPHYRRLHDTLERRDLTIDAIERLEALRDRAMRLYRKCRLEHFFFLKLQSERSLRDLLYKQVVEAFEQMSTLDEAERTLRALPDESLAVDLLGNDATLEHQAWAPYR